MFPEWIVNALMSSGKSRGLFRWLLYGVAGLLIVLFATVVVIFIMRERIASLVLDIAESRLAERGLYLGRTSHELSWRRGVILHELALYADKEKQKKVGQLANFGVWIPLHELFGKDPTVVFTSVDGDLTLETTAGNLRLDQVDFHLTTQQESLKIDRLQSRLNGLRITAGGLLDWAVGGSSEKFAIPDLAPLVEASSWLDFPQGSPVLALQLQSDANAPGGIDLSGVLDGSGFHWKHLSVDKAKVRFEMAPNRLSIPALSIDCHGGNLSGNLAIDYQKGELLVTEVVSTVEPFRFVSAILQNDSLGSCRSVGQTTMRGKNITFDLKRFAGSRGTFQVSSPQGIAIRSGSGEIALRQFHGALKFMDGSMVVDGSEFTLHGGRGHGTYTMPLSGGYRYQLKVHADDVSLAEMGRESGLKSELVGTMSADFDGGGAAGVKSHHGNGNVTVRNGKFYAIPVYGSLRAILTEQSPHFGMDEARDLDATFSLKGGILQSPDFRVESSATRIQAKGQVDLIQKTLDADVRAELKGIVGVATDIVSRIFEVHGEGPLDAVRWKLAHVPHLVEGAAHVTGEGVEEVAETTGKVIEGVGKAALKVIEDRPRIFRPHGKEPPAEK